jgi:hypothetical protein
MAQNISPAVSIVNSKAICADGRRSIASLMMKKTQHNRVITEADQYAAARLKALWLEIPRDRRPTQQQLADAWDGPGEANQSLISQYMNGGIALNYRALLFFAKALGVAPEQIRNDLPEQQIAKASTVQETAAPYRRTSQSQRIDPDTFADTVHTLLTILRRRDKTAVIDVENPDDVAMLCDAYNELVDLDDDAGEMLAGAAIADLIAIREGKRNGRPGGKGTAPQPTAGEHRKQARKAGAGG